MGYVLRLTEENGYDMPKWIFDMAGLKVNVAVGGWPALYDPHSDFRSLRHMLGMEDGEFTGVKYQLQDAGMSLIVFGSLLSKRLVRLWPPKLCPACLARASYHRGYWDLLPYTACPEHGLMLIDRCPWCGKQIHWSRGRVSFCRCGADLREATAVNADPSTLDLSARILQLCEHPPAGRVSESKQRNPLFELDLGDLCQVLTLLADNYLFMTRGGELTPQTDNFSSHEAYARAFRAFADWPKNLYEHLDEVKRLRGREILDSQLFYDFQRQAYKRELHFAIIAVEDYVEKNEWEEFPFGIKSPPFFRRFISKLEAGRQLQVNGKRLGALVNNGKLRIAYRWRGSEALIDSASIDEMRNGLDRLLTLSLAARVMGVGSRDIEDLVRHGCLRAASGPEADGLPELRFEERDLYSLLDAIDERLIYPAIMAQEYFIGADEIIARLHRIGIGIGRFTQDILSGNIAPAGRRKRPGLVSFLFLKVDVSGYLERLGAGKGRVRRRQSDVPEYKLWASALAALMKNNVSIRQQGNDSRRASTTGAAMDVQELARVGRQLFFRSDDMRS